MLVLGFNYYLIIYILLDTYYQIERELTWDMGIVGTTTFSCFSEVGIGSFLTARATGMPPSAELMEAAGANPAPLGNELTPCTIC